MIQAHLKPKYGVELIKKGRAHFYEVKEKGLMLPGVTGTLGIIAKPALVPWATREALLTVQTALNNHLGEVEITQEWIASLMAEAKARPDKIKDDAADLGTRAHAHIDFIIRGMEPETIEDDIKPAVDAFRDWFKNSGIKIVMGDTKVASLLHCYGGSLDALGEKDGKLILIDFKTANGVYDEYALQVSAYAKAFEETYGQEVPSAQIIRFGKNNPDFEVRELSDIDKSFRAFLAAKSLKELLKDGHFK